MTNQFVMRNRSDSSFNSTGSFPFTLWSSLVIISPGRRLGFRSRAANRWVNKGQDRTSTLIVEITYSILSRKAKKKGKTFVIQQPSLTCILLSSAASAPNLMYHELSCVPAIFVCFQHLAPLHLPALFSLAQIPVPVNVWCQQHVCRPCNHFIFPALFFLHTQVLST